MNIQNRLEIALEAAVAAGRILSDRSDDVFRRTAKTKESARDIVTGVDFLAEKAAVDIISKKDQSTTIIAEESSHKETKESSRSGDYWLIDALDGTVNYINGIPLFATSIAFVEKGLFSIGVVYAPALRDLYYGALGLGVFKNERRIKSLDLVPEQSLFAGTFSCKAYEANRKQEFDIFKEINDTTMGVLRTGSASLNCSYLAEGRLGGCWGKFSKEWDVGAGLCLAELSGAKVKIVRSDDKPELISYIAAVPQCWDFLSAKTSQLF